MKLNKKGNIKYMDLKNYIPPFIRSKNNNYKIITKFINPNKIELVYFTKSKHKNLVQEYKISIPRRLPLNSHILSMIGLLEAEMDKSSNNHITFSNSEPNLIKFIIHCFQKYFNVHPSQWGWLIQFNKKLTYSENYLKLKSRELASLEFWRKEVPISGRVARKWCTYRGLDDGLILTKNKWGMLHMFYSNILLKNVLLNVIGNKTLINSVSRKLRGFYLDGLFCGDGSLSHSNDVRTVSLTSYDVCRRKKINDLINPLDINSHISRMKVYTNDSKSIFYFYKLGLFKLHPEKRMKFLNLLLSYKQLQGRSRLIKKDFENHKKLIRKEKKKLLDMIQKRRTNFDYIQNKYKRYVKPRFNYEIEIKLKGLARKPTKYKIANIICQNPGLLIQDIVGRTILNSSSIYHAVCRLYKDNLVLKELKTNSNKVRLFPSNKLLNELEGAKKLVDKFNKRYEIKGYKNGRT